MTKTFVFAAALLALGTSAFAGFLDDKMPKLDAGSVMTVCGPDIKALCSGTPPAQIVACLKGQDKMKLTTACATKVAKMKTPVAPTVPNAVPSPSAIKLPGT